MHLAGRMGRVVADTESWMLPSLSRRRRDRVVLPAPEGEDRNQHQAPPRDLVIRHFEIAHETGRSPP